MSPISPISPIGDIANHMIRNAAVAGAFYPADIAELEATIRDCFLNATLGPGSLPEVNATGPRDVFGLICPHAGYPYSGYQAARAYHRLARDGKPDSVVIIGPNHRGIGQPLAVCAHGAWKTPLGEVAVDEDLAARLLAGSKYLREDDRAHLLEHSLEVQLPFLQSVYGSDFKIVPVAVAILDDEAAEDIGSALAASLADANAVVIASSDFSHYVPREVAEKKDSAAIEAIKTLDPDRLFEAVARLGITMCGVVPVASLMAAAQKIGGLHANLLGYNTSGDVTGEGSQVVGYVSMEITKEA